MYLYVCLLLEKCASLTSTIILHPLTYLSQIKKKVSWLLDHLVYQFKSSVLMAGFVTGEDQTRSLSDTVFLLLFERFWSSFSLSIRMQCSTDQHFYYYQISMISFFENCLKNWNLSKMQLIQVFRLSQQQMAWSVMDIEYNKILVKLTVK